MKLFKIKTLEVRVCEVEYEINAKDFAGARAAIKPNGGIGDDDVGEIADEKVNLHSIRSQEVISAKKLAKKTNFLMHSFDQNLDDLLGYEEESLEEMKSVQLVISIVRAENWESTGVFNVKLGLSYIAGISQGAYGKWCYTLWSGENRNPQTGYETRFGAAFAAVAHYLKDRSEI